MAAKCENCERLEKQNADLIGRLRDLQSQSVADLIKHCESGTCSSHAKEWDALKENIVSKVYASIPRDLIEAKAEELGLLPKSIRINLGE